MKKANVWRRALCALGRHDWKRAQRRADCSGMKVCRYCPEFRNVTLRKPVKAKLAQDGIYKPELPRTQEPFA